MIGEYRHTLDLKGRVIVPAKFREDLGERFYITKGLDGCLFVLSEEEWRTLVNKLMAMPTSKAAGIQRFFFAGAAQAEPDKQGRILIPPQLRGYAGLQKEIAFVGAASRAEIWDAQRWSRVNADLTQESLRSAMDELGF